MASIDTIRPEQTLVEEKSAPKPQSESQKEMCCMGPTHLLFGDTHADNKYVSYFLWYSAMLFFCILFPPVSTYFMIYQHPKQLVREGLNEGTGGFVNGVADFSGKRETDSTGAQRKREQGDSNRVDADPNRMMYLMLSFMLTVLCWVPGIVFNGVLFFCCVYPLQSEKDEQV